jgi:hypothetical protein
MDATLPILERIASALERIAATSERPESMLLSFEDVPKHYPAISERAITDACSKPNGPRRFKPRVVSTREIEAWIQREEKSKGPRQ